MNTNPLQRLQLHWDARAAGNFICGGMGAALVAFTAMHAMGSPAAVPLLVLGLALVGLGLLCVWFEIGRPWRAMNVMIHVRTSWMSRESVAAAVLFLLGAGLIFGMSWRAWPTALVALVFIYCQARILMAARGIPAWRMPQTGVLVVVTALTEGVGLFCLFAPWVAPPAFAPFVLALLVGVRAAAFEWWRQRLAGSAGTPTRRWAARIVPHARVFGAGLPLLALTASAFFRPPAPLLIAAAGLLAVATGAAFKFVLITRMGQHHGYSIPRMPVRGVPRVAPR